MDIRSSQELVWENKVGKGFNTTDIPLEFCLLQGEIAEAFEAWRQGRDDLGEELADVAIYLLGLAEMAGVNLQGEVEAKLAMNAARVYQRAYRTTKLGQPTRPSASRWTCLFASRQPFLAMTGRGMSCSQQLKSSMRSCAWRPMMPRRLSRYRSSAGPSRTSRDRGGGA
jgi:hypothetical protein